MKILYIYRHSNMGYSIEKVFKTIEMEIKKHIEVDSIHLPNDNYKILNLIANIQYARKKIKEKEYDIVHITGTEHYLLPFINHKNIIITIHDLGFYSNSKNSILKLFKYLLWVRSIKLAKKVTFISHKTYIETKRYIELKPEQYIIISNPVNQNYKYHPKKQNKDNPIILQIGTMSNKNIENTIIALSKFTCKFRIIGKLYKKQKDLLQKYHIDYSNVENLSDEEIIKEYINCDYVFFPSLYEGFGMPIIEGQSIGRVVITSDLSPMKDIALDSAILVNPYDIESIIKGYQKASKQYNDLVYKGLENVKRFNAKKIASEYLDLYHKF